MAGPHPTPVTGALTSAFAPVSQGPVNHSSWVLPLPHCSHASPCPLPLGSQGGTGAHRRGKEPWLGAVRRSVPEWRLEPTAPVMKNTSSHFHLVKI